MAVTVAHLFCTLTLLLVALGSPAVTLAATPYRTTAAQARISVDHADREMLALVDSLWRNGARDSSAVLTRMAAARARGGGDSTALLEYLLRAGQHARFFGQAIEAELDLREAIRLAAAHGDTAREVSALRWLSSVVGMQGRGDEARDLAARLLALAEAIGDQRHQGWGLVGLAWDAVRRGRAVEAEELYGRAAGRFAACGDLEGALWSELGLGHTLTSLGRPHAAVEAYRRAVGIGQRLGEPVSEAVALNDLGALEYYLGDPEQARAMFSRSAGLHRGIGSLMETVTPSVNIALCDRTLGRFEASEETLRANLGLCRSRGWRDLEATVRVHLAKLHTARGWPREAAREYRELLREQDTLPLRSRVQCLGWLAEAVAEADSPRVALALLDDARLCLDGQGENELLPGLLVQRSRLLRVMGDPQQAAVEARLAATRARALNQAQREIDALVEEAAAERDIGRDTVARERLIAAAERWEQDRTRSSDPAWREHRGPSGQRLYTALAAVLLGVPAHRPAFALASSMESAPTEAPGSTDSPVSASGARPEQVSEAFDRLQALKSRTLLERMLGPGERVGGGDRATRGEPPDAAGQGVSSGQRSIGPLITLDELRSSVLRPGELFLDAYIGTGRSFLFAVTCDSACVLVLPGEEDLDERLLRYHQLASRPPRTGDEASVLDPLRRCGAELAGTLAGEIADWIAASETVYLAADGKLNLVPPAELFSHLPGNRRPLWVRVPSATILGEMRRDPDSMAGDAPSTYMTGRPAPMILAVAGTQASPGRPLRQTVKEVRAIGREYRNVEVRVDPGPDDALERLMEKAEVLHLASHLRLDEQNPWQSELRLYPPGSPENLRGAEIASLRLVARLAVLSSCSSAGGRIVSGEGVLGVTSAFLDAGVHCVVATLWPVDDAVTARLMGFFYRGLARGETVAQALSDAQQSLKSNPRTAHPFYWAGFIVVGEGETRIPVRPRPRWPALASLWLAAVLAATVAAASISYGRSR